MWQCFNLLLKCVTLSVIYLHGVSLAFKNIKALRIFLSVIPFMGFVLHCI